MQTPETNLTLYVKYTEIKFEVKKKNIRHKHLVGLEAFLNADIQNRLNTYIEGFYCI